MPHAVLLAETVCGEDVFTAPVLCRVQAAQVLPAQRVNDGPLPETLERRTPVVAQAQLRSVQTPHALVCRDHAMAKRGSKTPSS